MYKSKTYLIRNLVPILFHNGELANPLNPIAKEMKKATAKRRKSDDDYELIAHLEWLGSFYPSEPGTFEVKNGKLRFEGFGVPVVPGENIESMLVEGARRSKLGKVFEAAVVCDGAFPVEPGPSAKPKTIRELFGDPNYSYSRRVVIQGRTVMRTRPIFNRWQVRATVSYLPSEVNEAQVDEVMETCGRIIALGDFKPRFGRFEVVNP